MCLSCNFLCSCALKYVPSEYQNEDMCINAVRKSYVLDYVHNQTYDICMEAVKNHPYQIVYVTDQTEDICIEAVKRKSTVIRFVKNKTEDICRYALLNTVYAICELKSDDLTDELRQLIKDKYGASGEHMIKTYADSKVYNDNKNNDDNVIIHYCVIDK